MKNGKALRILLSLVLLIAVMPFASFTVNAAETNVAYYNLIGFINDGPDGAIKKVVVNGKEVPECDPNDPESWGKLSVQSDEGILVVMSFNDGYSLRLDGERTVAIGGVQSESDNIDNTAAFYPIVELDIPGEVWQDAYDESDLYLVICTSGEDDEHYIDMPKLIDSVELTVTPPLCGTVVTAEIEEENPDQPTVKAAPDAVDVKPDYDWDTQDPYPQVTVPEDAPYELDEEEDMLYGYWVEWDKENESIIGLYVNNDENKCMVGGNTVFAQIYIRVKGDEYIFSPYLEVNVEGGELESTLGLGESFLDYIVSVEVEHVPGDPEDEEGVEPTCLEDGYHYEVVHCTKCGEELSREKVTDDALGHDWGEWKVTKEPTDDADGEETRICKRDPSHIETRPLEKDSPDTSDSGKIILWGTLSAMSLAGLVWLDHESRKHSR